MKKIITLVLVLLTLAPLMPAQAAKAPAEKVYSLTQLSGNLLLEKNSDRIWYADPVKHIRYIIRDDADLAWLTDNLALALPAATFAKIPDAHTATTLAYEGKYSGRLISDVSDPNNSWYVSPATGKRYPMDTFANIEQLATDTGITVGPKSLAKLRMTTKQIAFDPLSLPLAYVRYDGDHFTGGKNATAILPLASLTKLMTAMVLLDTNIDFDKTITITANEINYPKTLVGGDATSEVDIRAGDQVQVQDLWVAMLLASSNQSAKILADNSGLSADEFVKKMNEKAAYFKLSHTRFSEMTGLNANNVTTPQEMAIIASRAFDSYRIAQQGVRTSYTFNVTGADGSPRTIVVANRNYSLMAFSPDAAKTGYLTEAQRNAVIKKNGNIIVVMHAFSMKQRNDTVQKLIP